MGGCFQDSGATLKEVFRTLSNYHYSIFRIVPEGLLHFNDWEDSYENYLHSNYLAISADHSLNDGPAVSQKAVANTAEDVFKKILDSDDIFEGLSKYEQEFSEDLVNIIFQNFVCAKEENNEELTEGLFSLMEYIIAKIIKKSETKYTPENILSLLSQKRLWQPGDPLKVHLGNGSQHLSGFINIDQVFSVDSTNLSSSAELYANSSTINFPEQSIDELSVSHLLEKTQSYRLPGSIISMGRRG